jgi:hypothetical protein
MAESNVKLCACGCGQPAPIARKTQRSQGAIRGQAQTYCSHHWKRPCPPTTYCSTGARKAHVIRAEAAVGHPLPKGADVHHPDEDPWNPNARLVICPSREYHKLLHTRARVLRAGGNPNTDRICASCRLVKPITDFPPVRRGSVLVNAYCHQCDALKHREYNRKRREEKDAALNGIPR